MPVMDEFRDERAELKNKPFREKLSYFWCYYKWQTIIGIAIVVCLVSIIRSMVTSKDYALYAAIINVYTVSSDNENSLIADYAEAAAISLDDYDIVLNSSLYLYEGLSDDTSYTTLQQIMIYIAARDLDLLAGDSLAFNQYAYQGVLYDLREILTEEQQEALEPYYYYVDYAIVEAEDDYDLAGDFTTEYPDPLSPEDMEDPVPVGLILQGQEVLSEVYISTDENYAIGVVLNTERMDHALAFIEYLFADVLAEID